MSIESLINLYSYGGPVAKNLPSNAGDAGLIPGWGTKIPYAMGKTHASQLRPDTAR